jgi:hypothetical protein
MIAAVLAAGTLIALSVVLNLAFLALAGGGVLGLAPVGFAVPSLRRPPRERYDLTTDDLVRRIDPNPPLHRETRRGWPFRPL